MSEREILTFGGFVLSAGRRTLTHEGRRLRIGDRALDILLLLAQRPGQVVTRDEIHAHVWKDIFVDEASVRVHLSALRKVLGPSGADCIATVAGRGYVLTAPVSRSVEAETPAPPEAPLHLPLRLERLIGRDTVVDSLTQQVLERRFVTVVGPGGIGKTSVALEVAVRLADAFPDGVRFVDLSTLENPESAPGALAIALGLPSLPDLSAETLARSLAGKRILIVLDNCERLVETAAAISEALLRSTPRLCVLATSREALRAQGEWLHRLPPLATPATASLTPRDAMKFSAIELFVDRAEAAAGYRLVPEDCDCVAEICRRLDGLPLAIELAATTVTTLGVRGVAAGLDDRLSVLSGGRRTAQSRHQTLRAALDWSYDRLSDAERGALNRLSVLAGRFDLALATQVLASDEVDSASARAHVASLVAKSLVALETGASDASYRLLESTRAYGREKLAASGGEAEVMRRYAEATLAFFRATREAWINAGVEAGLARHGTRLEDVRAVLEWAFSAGGDRKLARELTAEASEVWLHAGLLRECVSWCRKVLGPAGHDNAPPDREEARILHAFSIALGFIRGNDPDNREAIAEANLAARQVGDHDYAVRGLWALASHEMNSGALPVALGYARELRRAAAGASAEAERLVGERIVGSVLHLMGRHAEARPCLERVRTAYADPALRGSPTRFQFDQLVLTQGFLAWLAWLAGDDQGARREVEEAVAQAAGTGHTRTLGFALDSAVNLAILTGRFADAERGCEALGQMGANLGFDVYMARREVLAGIIQVRTGDLTRGLPRLQAALSPAVWSMATYRTPHWLAELAQAELAAGQGHRALATIDAAIQWFGGVDDFWCAADCFRVKAEILQRRGGTESARCAQALLARASAVAVAQGAEAWSRRLPSPVA